MKHLGRALAVVCLLLNVHPAFADLRDGLVSYWPLDVDNSGTTPDPSFTNDLTLVSGPTVGTGQVSNAFTFNGTSQYLSITHGTTNADTGLPIYYIGGVC